MDKHEKYKIGLMTGDFHTTHSKHLIEEIYKLLKKREDIEAEFYMATESSSFVSGFRLAENQYDYQYASLFGYSHLADLDVLIISLGTVSIHQHALRIQQILENLPKVPVVLLEQNREVADGCCVIIDNASGIYHCVEHLAQEHGLTKIAFLTGPDGNQDGEERLSAYRRAMKDLNLQLPDSYIGHGDFTLNCEAEVRRLLTLPDRPQAIVSANDQMAITIYKVCHEMGLEVGKDVAVTGFDYAPESRWLDPPLTTIYQDYAKMARTAVQKVDDILQTGKAESETVPVTFICRSSCGCHETEPESKREEQPLRPDENQETRTGNWKDQMTSVLAGDRNWVNRTDRHYTWIGALMLRELQEAADMKDFYSRLGRGLCYLQCEHASVFMLPQAAVLDEDAILEPPTLVKQYLKQEGDTYTAYGEEDAVTISKTDSWEGNRTLTSGRISMMFLLFFEEYHYGVFRVVIPPEEVEFYYMLSLEIGSGIRYLIMRREQREAQEHLRNHNEELDFIVHHDALTGLFNRLGFREKAQGEVLYPHAEEYFMMFADLDHLKQINDNLGHSSGDAAIRTTARILQQSLGDEILVGRISGDEFMALIPITSDDLEQQIRSRMKQACDRYNHNSGKKYIVSISYGLYRFKPREMSNLGQISRYADALLYEAKQKRMECVIRKDV